MKALLQSASLLSGRKPRIVVIGGHGKAGSGVVEFAKTMGVDVTVWGRKETAKGGPFIELLEFGAQPWTAHTDTHGHTHLQTDAQTHRHTDAYSQLTDSMQTFW